MTVSHLVLLQFLYGSALTDLYDRRIPNTLTGMYLSLGLFLNFRCISFLHMTGTFNLSYSLSFLVTFLVSVLILSVLTAMTNAGAGDAKLIALIISWTGFYEGLHLLLPGLILALAFILISKAETDLSAPGFRYGNTLTPGGIKRSIPFLNPYVSPILLRTVPYKSGKNKIFCLKNKLLRDFGAYIRIPKRRSLPLAVPVFLGAIPRLITYCFQ